MAQLKATTVKDSLTVKSGNNVFKVEPSGSGINITVNNKNSIEIAANGDATVAKARTAESLANPGSLTFPDGSKVSLTDDVTIDQNMLGVQSQISNLQNQMTQSTNNLLATLKQNRKIEYMGILKTSNPYYLLLSRCNNGHIVNNFGIDDSSKLYCYHQRPGYDTSRIFCTNIITATSDIRLKKNVKDSTLSGLDLINKIQLREFDWIDSRKISHQKIGFIADEIEKFDPLLVEGGGYDEDGDMIVKTVDSFYLQGYEVKAIQELSQENKELKKQIEDLTKRIEKLENK